MSIIVLSGTALCNSPLNTSKAKMMYSFSKAERFPKLKHSGSDVFYNLPDLKSTRAASIGKGRKYDFTCLKKGRTDNMYNLGTDFNIKNPHSPMYSFGIGRNYYGKVYLESNKNIDIQIPGPAKYNVPYRFGNEMPKYTMRMKTKYIHSTTSDITPGPGKYHNIMKINPKGKYYTSKIRNIRQIDLGIDKSRRTDYSKNRNPGPADYPQKQLLGTVYNSRFLSYMGKTMGERFPLKNSRDKYPGPGSYILPSDFGIYESKNAQMNKTSRNGVKFLHKSKSIGAY